jgi:cytochrome P450
MSTEADRVDVDGHYDYRLVAAMEDPSEVITAARQSCPVSRSDAYGGYWALFSYDDIGAVARDPETFTSNRGLGIPDHGYPIRLPPIEIDPPRHFQFKSPLLARFAPAQVATLEPQIREAITRSIDEFIERGSADFANELSISLPATFIPLLFNLPVEDGRKFHHWSAQSLKVENDMESAMEMFAYFNAIYEDRVQNPQDPEEDLTSFFMSMEVDGKLLDQMEVVAMLICIVSAGVDTTANAASHMLDILEKRPHLRDRLIREPEVIPKAIEEFLRYITPVACEARVVTKPTEINGVSIAEDDRVTVNWLAANHDPAAFPDPETIDFDRHPNRHYAFGVGPHRCLGLHLARLELKVLLEEVMRRIPDYVVDRDNIDRYAGVTRGIARLPVTFPPGPRESSAAVGL